MSSERLNVIALISGGKDSFYSLLHCIERGHRVVALANLFPGTGSETRNPVAGAGLPVSPRDESRPHSQSAPHAEEVSPSFTLPPGLQIIDPAEWTADEAATVGQEQELDQELSEKDLNSFMYQTVGHEVLPLYAAATGLPLYRLPINGRAVHHERDYDATGAQDSEETESMLPLLRAIMSRHPEANALCAGAILSTYQRTRVESIALRLGLVPLAYLWQYPVLPPPYPVIAAAVSETQLLTDMAKAGLDARIIKVASAGLDEGHLWERVSSEDGIRRVKSALRKFGSGGGAAALGEGGEFETLVVDGPAHLFKTRISVPEHGRKVVREGGGCSWLLLGGARLEEKADPEQELTVRTPGLLDSRFKDILEGLELAPLTQDSVQSFRSSRRSAMSSGRGSGSASAGINVLHWSFFADPDSSERSIQEETIQVVERIRKSASAAALDPAKITNTIIVLRRMSDFPQVNGEYGKLFPKPNPPSRVTISCGDLLPAGTNIGVFLTAPGLNGDVGRNGLHVQSRSYWAPANIGPYSQAIDVPVNAQEADASDNMRLVETGVRSISIAGQIPLIPATMLLPGPSKTSHEMQVVLALQHLWRVAQELKVQYWTSSVAYFPRSDTIAEMKHNAKVAGIVWKQAHGSPEEEEDESGPDPWDLKYNPAYQTLAGHDAQEERRSVPDWSILTPRQLNEPETCIPPMFAVEVEELPRQSAVEWHAHKGLSKVDEGCLELSCDPEVGTPGWTVWQSIVNTEKATLLYSTLSCSFGQELGSKPLEELDGAMSKVYADSLQRLGLEPSVRKSYLAYVDATEFESWGPTGIASTHQATIPCRSIWSPFGERLRVVAVFECAFYA
ncbi:hypothetical protein B0J13DRAFT_17353 [Dactylonectria estremocensis]|uniref:Diphthine--ammonia ligase n=1 Tax=Dactylonectria estremocensis TaxID=1079267 RepID=A0A9P9FJ42_9HYPO|nr:hypothetical protein B0J13DRAFT_17353 [Dactylonectria estremocensis]